MGLLRYAIRDSLIERNIQLDLQILQAAKQSREPFILAEIVEAAQMCGGSFSAATLAFQAMCHAAMSQKRIARGCNVVTCRKRRRTRPHSVRSQATCASTKRASATSERNPFSAATNPICPSCSRKPRLKSTARRCSSRCVAEIECSIGNRAAPKSATLVSTRKKRIIIPYDKKRTRRGGDKSR